MGLRLPIQMLLVPVDVVLHLRFNFLNTIIILSLNRFAQMFVRMSIVFKKIKQISDSMKAVLE